MVRMTAPGGSQAASVRAERTAAKSFFIIALPFVLRRPYAGSSLPEEYGADEVEIRNTWAAKAAAPLLKRR
jgi:hypothetical protein